MKKRLAFIVGIICLFLCYSAQSSHGEAYPLGVIMTNNAKEKSVMVFLDENLTPLSEVVYNAANVTSGKGITSDSKAYMAANGNWDLLDRGIVVSIDMIDGAVKEFNLNRVNITDLQADHEWIYANSNLNWEFFFDRININTGEIQSAKISDLLIYSFTAFDDVIYAVAEEASDQSMALYSYSFVTDEWDKLCTMLDSECIGYTDIECVGEKIYVIIDDVLYIYSISDHILRDHEIGNSPASKLCIVSNDVYIVISDPAAGSDESIVEKYICENDRMETIGTYNGTILQIQFAGENVFIMDYEVLIKAHIYDGEFVTDSTYFFSTDYDYCGGLFIK